ncbi:hypothetical protein RFI_32452 [Reticulomyxa filosa]|uniref:RanBP2-type domain-containing protein n=1 Tax=Reticulomyxa filosa TaxID=46433 RepID=X6LTJ0_RETFI|nr:hypothetical protein RFI_32452 [Reticulomyxa filosa]|eukprot:ETO04944.1 hypothetical protein RFI_32452 [Reticulomyxa filosa]
MLTNQEKDIKENVFQKVQTDDWNCSTCQKSNKQQYLQCIKYQTPRPNYDQLKNQQFLLPHNHYLYYSRKLQQIQAMKWFSKAAQLKKSVMCNNKKNLHADIIYCSLSRIGEGGWEKTLYLSAIISFGDITEYELINQYYYYYYYYLFKKKKKRDYFTKKIKTFFFFFA